VTSGSCNVSTPVIKRTYILLSLFAVLLLLLCGRCSEPSDQQAPAVKSDTLVYLNHADSARYVGMNACRQCHQAIYNTFVETGMGQSIEVASRKKSAADYSRPGIYDRIADLRYRAYWDQDSLFIQEYRLNKKDTVHNRREQVSYIIGSGQHTNSHLQNINGYIHQMPMTYYTQKQHWDLPPGFENGVNTRFSRKIGLECMSCHNGYPDFVMGSENKYRSVPQGIDCERCHGPGSIHVAQRSTGSRIDTSRYIDYSIVNPAKLSIDAQFDLCQRCHLQGNAVLKEGKSFFDFKPGQKLSDYISVFLPKYENADDEFIMASHADRLKQSACFIKSYEKVKHSTELKPYKEALTCVTCHDPHVSVRHTNKNVFNDACLRCHSDPKALETSHQSLKAGSWTNCVSCHMPSSGSTDIPHVSVHDHYIRKPVTRKEQEKIRKFLGLYSVNESQPATLTRARAYIDQYEKFEQTPAYLDSALSILKGEPDLSKTIRYYIQIYFIRQDFRQVVSLVNRFGERRCDSLFVSSSFENKDAWAAYRIADAYSNTGNTREALKWFRRAADLAPYNLDFRNKLGTTLASANDLEGAAGQFEFILKENPRFVSSYANLGYIKLVQGFPAEALRLYTLGKQLDPDNETLLLNLAAYHMAMKDRQAARKYLEAVLHKNPANRRAQAALQQLSRL
jgi:tetratricopeptide (TPR) repeat protein